MPDTSSGLAPLVLVVEDEELIAAVVADCLQEWGFRVLRAANAIQAIELLTSGDKISLVFSDVVMPGNLDGFGLARWVRAHCNSKVRVMLTSGHWRPGQPAPELGDVPLLPKPYNWEELRRRVVSLVGEPPRSVPSAK